MSATDQKLKDDLKRIDGQLDEAREEKASKVTARDEARDQYANSGAEPGSDEFKAAREAVKAVGEVEDKIAELTEKKVGILELLGRDGEAAQAIGIDRPSGEAPDAQGEWQSGALLQDGENQRMLKEFEHSSIKVGRYSLGEAVSRDAFAADVVGTTSMRRGDYFGIVPQLRRGLTVLDLLPTGTMDQNTLPYTQESGAFTGAVEQVEGDAKAEGAITFTDAEATARTIAAWLKLQKQSLADYPALRTIIDSRLRYLVLRRLEAQVLAGNGTAPNLRGILNTSGIGTVTYDSGQESADSVLDGITTVLLADAQATGIVMHPTDWSASLKSKASGDGHYFSGGPYSVTPQQMWGVPLIPSAAITAGTVLVGDFDIGAILMIREGVQVLLSDSDQDDFTKNKVTLLGEMRAALPVFRPAAFVTVDIAA